MLAAWSPVDISFPAAEHGGATRWALVSEWSLADLKALTPPVGAWGATALIAGFALCLGVGAAWWIGLGVTRQASSISRTLALLGQGQSDVRAERITNDELGEVATTLNTVCESKFAHSVAPHQAHEIQQSLGHLMTELERIAAGDLTIKTHANDDVIGPLATSINYMIGQLREVVHNSQYATSQVGVSATRIQAAAEHLYRGSASQTRQIAAASIAVEDLAQLIQQTALDTIDMASAAGEIHQDAVRGSSAMKQAMLNIAGMRHHTQETSKRIKQMCERLQEAGETERWIRDIATRVGILSLNASIHAAASGDDNQGFVAVAEGLQQLSERSETAAKRAASMHKAILSEAEKARNGMEQNTREVVECTRVSAEAARLVGDIESSSALGRQGRFHVHRCEAAVAHGGRHRHRDERGRAGVRAAHGRGQASGRLHQSVGRLDGQPAAFAEAVSRRPPLAIKGDRRCARGIGHGSALARRGGATCSSARNGVISHRQRL